MADGVASDSDGSDIPGVDEFVRNDFDGEMADNPLDRAQHNAADDDGETLPPGAANLFGESDDSDDELEGFDQDWVTDPGLFRRVKRPDCSLDGGSAYDHPEESTAGYYFGLFWDEQVSSEIK